MASSNGTDQASAVAAATGLAEVTVLLHSLLAQSRVEPINLGISDAHGQGLTLEHWPVTGTKRVLAYRTGNGYDGLSVPTTGILLAGPNEARIGSNWSNSGTNPIILYLSDQQRKGVPAVWLSANGGSWDGLWSGLVWAGNIFAVAQTATSTIVGGEL